MKYRIVKYWYSYFGKLQERFYIEEKVFLLGWSRIDQSVEYMSYQEAFDALKILNTTKKRTVIQEFTRKDLE